MKNVLDWPVRRPMLALLLAVVVTAAALLLTVLRLRPETSLQGLLDESDPAVVAMGEVLDRYPVVNELLVLATLPASAPDDPAPLVAFAKRLTDALTNDAAARPLISRVQYRADEQARAFVERVVVPSGLYYLSDDQLQEVLRRLTRTGMDAQLARDRAMLALPGPAAGGLAKAFAKDPLRLHEFVVDRLTGLSIPGSGATGAGGAFLSPDRRSLLMRVDGARPPSDFNFAKRLTTEVRRVAAGQNAGRLRIDVAGAYAMAAHSATKIQADSTSDVVSTVLGLAVLFTIACRRPARLFTFAFLPVAAGLVWGFAAYALFRQRITPLAAVVGGTLGAIGLDYTVHYITHYQQTRRGFASTIDAVRATSREMFFPSLAAWTTSVIGFAAVGISPIRVLRDFSILGTLCLVGAWLGTLLVLPAMLSRFARRDAAMFEGRVNVSAVVGHWISRHARGLLIVAVVFVAGIAALLVARGARYEFNSDPMAMHPQPSPPLEAQRFIAERMQVAAGALIVHLRAGSPDALVSLAHTVQKRLDVDTVRSAGISGVFGLASLLPEPAEAARRRASIDPNLPQRVTDDLRAALEASDFRPAAFDAYAAFLKTLVAPGPPPGVGALAGYPAVAQLVLPRESIVADGVSASTAQGTQGEPGTRGTHGTPATQGTQGPQASGETAATQAVTLLFSRGPFESRDARVGALRAVRAALAGVDGATVTGTAAIGQDLESAMSRDLPRFFAVSLACILAYLLAHFRSVTLALMALLPIAISLLCVTAFVSLAHVELNFIHAAAVPLLLGINLDYGIFAVHAWRSSHDPRGLSHHFPASFSALLMCGGSTLIGFGSLVITSVPAVRSLGWLINVGVGTCVLSTLFVLWPAMMLARRRATKAAVDAPISSLV